MPAPPGFGFNPRASVGRVWCAVPVLDMDVEESSPVWCEWVGDALVLREVEGSTVVMCRQDEREVVVAERRGKGKSQVVAEAVPAAVAKPVPYVSRRMSLLDVVLGEDINNWRRWGFTRDQVREMAQLVLHPFSEQVERVMEVWDGRS